MMKKKERGAFIVLDGVDGSGKATQTELLVDALRKKGKKVKEIHFPRYDETFFGALIGECLTGQRGDFLKLDPYIASVIYAAERYESAALIRAWLAKGYVVIADRYSSSSQIHQGSKIRDIKRRKRFLAWLDTMEFGVFSIPRPDMIVYLDIPVSFAKRLLAQKSASEKKTYLKGKKDVVEGDREYMEESRKSATRLAKSGNIWKTISCVRGNTLRTREEIHADIFRACGAIA